MVIPAYNAAATVQQAIDSVLAQSFADFEILVVDDGSTDDTATAVRAVNDPRVRLLAQPNGGAAAARNTGIASTVGEWVAFLDADDLWLPRKLELQLSRMRAVPGCLASQGAAYFVDRDLQMLKFRPCKPRKQLLLTFLRFQNLPNAASSWVVKRELLERIGGFDTGLAMIEDWDLSIKLAQHANPICIEEPLTLYRVHAGNRSLNVEAHLQSGRTILDRVFADPALPAEVRRHEREIYARLYTMLCGGMLRVGRRRRSIYWGLRALTTHPRVLGYMLMTPLRRFVRRPPASPPAELVSLQVLTAQRRWRALVAFTTCDRSGYVRRCLPQLAHACRSEPRVDVLVALDGDDTQTREFCTEWEVPLLYSEAREGVGLSKNRVLERFPDYDFYFFLEDDVEVVDGSVFARHVELMRNAGIHHMSLFTDSRSYESCGETIVEGRAIKHYERGGAQLNAFTREGLQQVGGWHPLFAQYRRWGHVEHSYRFPRNGLAPAPFNVASDLVDTCICHVPPPVTKWSADSLNSDGLSKPERELMDRELRYVPLETLASYHLQGPEPRPLVKLAGAFDGRRRYPLLRGPERRRAYADYLSWRSRVARNPWQTAALLVAAGACDPTSIGLRHAIRLQLVALQSRLRR